MLSATLLLTLTVIDGLAWDLLDRNGAEEDFERGAFIVRAADGDLSLIEWPASHLFRRARWTGVLPENVIAVMHTHPLHMPRPSLIDIAESRRTGLPFYVVTRMTLCRVDPDRRVHCSSAKPRAKVRRVTPAADHGLPAALEVYPE